ncbi:MAG: peptide deformylase [Candidatus Hodarchaeota archaeon]
MLVLPILLLGNPLLREQSSPVEDFNQKELQQTITNMEDTLAHLQKQEGLGRGLAAPQIGIPKQIIVFKTSGAPNVMINPKIRETSTDKFLVWDSCFCFKLAFFVEVERFQKICVEYQDTKGVREVIDAEDTLAELFQHEIDHLHGVLAIDRMTSTQRICMREEWENQFQ